MPAPFLNFPVSLILAMGIVFCLVKVFAKGSWVDRSNYVLHALMGLGMLGMVWQIFYLPLLPQLLLFGLASFWFLLQAVSGTKFSAVGSVCARRLKHLYDAAMLAAVVFMLFVPHSVAQQDPSTAASLSHGHVSHLSHTPSVVGHPSPGDVMLWNQWCVQVLAALFCIAAVGWLAPMGRIVQKLRPTKDARRSVRTRLSAERYYEAGTALSMSLMFGSLGLHT